jgi:hypothetical protein
MCYKSEWFRWQRATRAEQDREELEAAPERTFGDLGSADHARRTIESGPKG